MAYQSMIEFEHLSLQTVLILTLCFQALFFRGADSLPWILARHEIPWLDVVVDPCAAFLVFLVTGLLCVGIKEVATFSDSARVITPFSKNMASDLSSLFFFRVHLCKELWQSWIALWCYLLLLLVVTSAFKQDGLATRLLAGNAKNPGTLISFFLKPAGIALT